MGGRVATAGLGFVNAVLAARVLGPEHFGLYSVALGAALTTTVLASAGVDSSLVAILPARLRQGRNSAAAVLGSAMLYVLVLGVCIIAPLVLVRGSVAVLMNKPALAPYLGIMMLSVPFAAMLHVARAASQAAFSFRQAVLPLSIIQPLLVLGGLILVHALLPRAHFAVAVAYLLAVLGTATIATWWLSRLPAYGWTWLRRALPLDTEFSERSASFLGIQIFVNLKSSVLLFVLAVSVTASEIGLFSAAARTAGLVSFILIAVNMVFVPTIAALWTEQDINKLGRVYRNMTKWTITVSVPICAGLALCAPGVLGMFGPGYRAAALPLALLCLGELVNAATGSVGYLLMMTGNERLVLRNAIGVTAVSFILAAFVAPRYGYVGVAAVQAVVVAGFNLLMLYQVWVTLKVHPFSRDIIGVLLAGGAAAMVGLALYRWAWAPATPLLLGLAATGTAMAAVYFAILLAIGLSSEDRTFLSENWTRFRARFAD